MAANRILSAVIGLIAAVGANPVFGEWFSRHEAIMGTAVDVELWSDDAAKANEAIAAVIAEMHHIDDTMSPFKPDSELSRINREAAQHPVPISREMYDILAKSIEFSKLSGGAFDVTFSSVGYLYDYRKHIRPTDAEIAEALPAISYRHLRLDPVKRTIRYDRDGVRVDLGGIAKGWAVDRSIEILKARGITNAMVMAGGDSRLLGDRRGRPWSVGIRNPFKQGEVIAVLPLQDTAISTSGDYERYFDEGGVRYHHIIDPKTGKSAHGVHSVTVLAADATTTEGLTKSIFVKGPVEGMRLIESMKGVDAIIVDAEGRLLYSDGLRSVVTPSSTGESPAPAKSPPVGE